MEKSESPRKCRSEAHMYEWYRDVKGRIWVVVGFWYEKNQKDKIYLLEYGTTQYIILPYATVQSEIEKKRMTIILQPVS